MFVNSVAIWIVLVLFNTPLLTAQTFNPHFKFHVAAPETLEDENHSVIYFVTNRLVLPSKKEGPAWNSLAPGSELFIRATNKPLAGWVLVKKKSDSVANSPTTQISSLQIERFFPHYDVRFKKIEEVPFFSNEVVFDGMTLIDSLWTKDVLIYIHGFNNNFETAMLRAAQLKRDLNFKGSVVALSWPSMGGPMGFSQYTDDERRYRQSLDAVAVFLRKISLQNGQIKNRGARYVLAHSMGNRVFLHGLASMIRPIESPQILKGKLFDRMIFAAPDMEVEDFKTHVTFANYYCRDDRSALFFHAASNYAVGTSELEHLNRRAGRNPVVMPRVLTIDAARAKSPWTELGHGYYASNDRVLKIISKFLASGHDALDKEELEAIKDLDGQRWRLK